MIIAFSRSTRLSLEVAQIRSISRACRIIRARRRYTSPCAPKHDPDNSRSPSRVSTRPPIGERGGAYSYRTREEHRTSTFLVFINFIVKQDFLAGLSSPGGRFRFFATCRFNCHLGVIEEECFFQSGKYGKDYPILILSRYILHSRIIYVKTFLR